MKSLVLSLVLTFTFFGSASEARFEAFSLKRTNGSLIHYYLDKPAHLNKFSVLIFLQGSECRSILGREFMPENVANKLGVGVLLIEKPGITPVQNSRDDDQKNCTPEFRALNTINQRVADALQVIAALRSNEGRWNRKLLVSGGSEGGAVAPILASLIPETKKVAMLAAGNGHDMATDLLEVLPVQARKAGATDKQVEALMQNHVVTLRRIRQEPTSSEIYMGHTFRWWNSILWINPMEFMLRLDVPMLLIHGTSDIAVPVSSARIAAATVKSSGKSNLDYWELPGLDHAFEDENGRSFKNEIFGKMLNWLLN